MKQRALLTRKRVLFAGLLICFAIVITTNFLPDFYWTPVENITCYYDYEDDVLPVVDREFRPSQRSIFFHETSCKGGLDSRQACAVEAAARAHPRWQIHVLFAAPVHSYQGPMKTLQRFRNINFARFHIQDYAKGTPLEYFISSGSLNQSRWRISHSSDVLRYTTLYKYGGIYLDLDAVVVKPLTSLKRNWAARESSIIVAAGALAFSRDPLGRTVAEKAIKEIAQNFRGDIWGYNGPGVITRVLQEMCATDDVLKMTPAKCAGFVVYGPKLFYPVRWQNADYYFKPGELNFPHTYIHHVWNRVTHNTPVTGGTRYAKLAKRYCPSVHKNHQEDFGEV